MILVISIRCVVMVGAIYFFIVKGLLLTKVFAALANGDLAGEKVLCTNGLAVEPMLILIAIVIDVLNGRRLIARQRDTRT